MKRCKEIIVLTILLVKSIYCGEYAGDFLTIGVGARALGMAGAFAGVADDATTTYWNPGGMTEIKGVEVSSIKQIKTGELDANYIFLNLVYNTGIEIGVFGISYLRQSYGSIKIIDEKGELITDSAEIGENAIYVSYAREITEWISAGTSIKILKGTYPTDSKETEYIGGGIDTGIKMDLLKITDKLTGLYLGINLQDLWIIMNWEEINSEEIYREIVKPNLKIGIAYKKSISLINIESQIIIAADIDTRYDGEYHTGAEVWIGGIGIRSGIKGFINQEKGVNQDNIISYGLSLKWKFIGIDYSYVNNEIMPIQYLSITGRF
jgi:hypothetical protein